jgi:hypothetical protein
VMEKILSTVHILQNFSNTGRVVRDFSHGAFREPPLTAIASLTAFKQILSP